MTLPHRIAHRLGWSGGRVVSALDERGTVWIGFQCVICGKVSSIHASYSQAPPMEAFTDAWRPIAEKLPTP